MRGLVFSIDDAYVMPFKVLWHSLIKTDSIPLNTPVFILHESSLSQGSIDELTKLIGNNGFNCSFIDATSLLPDDLPIKDGDHVSKATFYRLYVASVLPESITSVVYLDSDAFVLRSIKPLFDLKLTAPVAAVDHLSPSNALRLWGDISGTYFQAGVLIIDIDAWRTANYESVFKKILREERSKIQWWDQCVLNLAFNENWQRLPIWYNVCASVRKIVDLDQIESRGCFIHLDGSGKPWKIFSRQAHFLHWYDAYSQAFGASFNIRALFRKRVRSKVHWLFSKLYS